MTLRGEDGAMASRPTALERFNACVADLEGEGPLERLRYFLSLALSGQDWLDVEPFLDALAVAADGAPAAPGPRPSQEDGNANGN